MKEGSKTYRYGYLDKVLSMRDGREHRTFTYHADGQLATATRTGGPRSVAAATGRAASPLAAETETFLWDGLGYAFLFRNYRPGLGKWQTADRYLSGM